MAKRSPSAAGDAGSGLVWGAAGLAAGLIALWMYHAVGQTLLDGFVLDLGSVGFPRPRHLTFLAYWGLFGAIGAVGLGFGAARLLATTSAPARFERAWVDSSPAAWMLVGTLLGFLVPVAIRALVLQGAAVADDESSYRFMAELIASGRLSVESHPLKLFFDRAHMINDGHMYAKYFVGWPALMAPAAPLGLTGWVNAVLSAATVPALMLVLRRLAGETWARAGLVIYLTAPMLMIAAATELAHTSCLAALAWTTWFVLRARDDDAPAWADAGVAVAFSLAFFVRPLSAIGIGLPLLVLWALSLRERSGRDAARAVVVFALPALLFAAAFLGVNRAQSGSAFTTAYEREMTYSQENDFRFTNVEPEEAERPPELRLDQPLVEHAAKTAAALFRLNFALYGWPIGLVFLPFARGRRTVVLWASVLTFSGLNLFIDNPGIDSFGPVHWFELAWPLLLLTVMGLARLAGALSEWSGMVARPDRRIFLRSAPAFLLAALIVVSLPGYTRPRLAALHRNAQDILAPVRAVHAAAPGEAVIFTFYPLARYCKSDPTRHFTLWRDNNDPDLKNPVLWVNHLTLDQDKVLMEHFPGRKALLLGWGDDCKVLLAPIDQMPPGSVPDVDGKR